jgi:hypothetical protein
LFSAYTATEDPLSSNAPYAEYQHRLGRRDAEIATLERTSRRISNFRLLNGGLAIAVAIFVMRGQVSAWALLLPAFSFLMLVVVHARIIDGINRARRARAWYERGRARLDGTWSGLAPDGARFLDGHPFAGDLDLFGPGSLFQLLNTARTEAGEDMLAGWLLAGAAPPEIVARQAAVDELRPAVDFREAVAVTAVGDHPGRTSGFMRWAAQPPAGFRPGMAVIFALVGLTSAVLLVTMYQGASDPRLFVLFLLVHSAFALSQWRKLWSALALVDVAARDLALLSAVLAQIEGQTFTSPRLRSLRESLMTEGAPPSQRIAQLLRYITWLDSTRNQIFAPIAWFLLVPFILAVLIDQWHTRYAGAISTWLHAAGELEAFAALGTYAYEHPADSFPVIVEDGPFFDAASLGHPLIPEKAAVTNDVALGGDHPHLLLVSGSNMSGKSTLLRAIGVNVVLGLAGAPVRARSLTLSPLTLGTSLRIDDSLQAGHSRFYAEILRIREIVGLTRSTEPQPVLFLLDEMLAGTNSHDRRIGAEAIVRTLVANGAIGLVTTHDLALADVVPSMGGLAENVHFEDRIENGTMIFDYRMRPGVVEHSNALALMRAIGLDV